MRNVSCAVALCATIACSPWAMGADSGTLSLRKQVLPASYQESSKTVVKTQMSEISESAYLGLSGFFNVREANVNTTEGEWELEFTGFYATGDNVEGDDDWAGGASLKYGITENMYLELELNPIVIGDGGDHGAGETTFTWFTQCWTETDSAPAFGAWLAARIPTGDGSSGVDGTLGMALTKTLADNWRGHLNGYLKTANGGRGSYNEEEDRRNFQWGMGAGVDYAFSEELLGTLNYTNAASDLYGGSNNQTVEAGLVYSLSDHSALKGAVDYGIENDEQGEWVGKIQYSIGF